MFISDPLPFVKTYINEIESTMNKEHKPTSGVANKRKSGYSGNVFWLPLV